MVAKQTQPEQPQLIHLLLAAAGLWVLWRLSPILTPFLLAVMLAYVCDPLVDKLEARRVPRGFGVLIALLLLVAVITALVLILTPLVQHETRAFVERLPTIIDWFKLHALPWLQNNFGVDAALDTEQIKTYLMTHIKSAGSLAEKLLPSLKSGGLALIAILINLLLVPVVFFYVLRDWDDLLARIEKLIPRRWHAKTLTIAQEVDSVLSEFLRGQISVMLLMSAYYVIALHFAGLQFALPIGLVTGLLVFIPYLGMAVGLSFATLAALIQFQSIGEIVPVLLAFGIGQALEGMLVTPWLVGERIGLHPVAVIFALLAFGQLFGFFGVLLALPASAALLVGFRHLKNHYLASELYNR
ncbi:MAG: AI-2E family transporter [Methylophilaceae bacterium]